MQESVQSCFELSIHLSVERTSRELLLKIVRGKKIQGNVWKVQNYPRASITRYTHARHESILIHSWQKIVQLLYIYIEGKM